MWLQRVHMRTRQNKSQNWLQSIGWNTYEFNIAGTSANITFLVQTTSTTWRTTVWLTIFASFAGIARSWSGTWTSTGRFGTSGTFQCRWNNFRWQMQVCAQVFNAFVFQVPTFIPRKERKTILFLLQISICRFPQITWVKWNCTYQ